MASKVDDIGITQEERDLSRRVLELKADLSNWGIKKINMETDLKQVNARLADLEIARRPKPPALNREKIHRQLVTHLLDIDTEKPVTGMIYGTQMSKYFHENYHISKIDHPDGQWHLLIERSEWIDDDLAKLENILFDWLDGEGITLADLHSAHMSEFPAHLVKGEKT